MFIARESCNVGAFLSDTYALVAFRSDGWWMCARCYGWFWIRHTIAFFPVILLRRFSPLGVIMLRARNSLNRGCMAAIGVLVRSAISWTVAAESSSSRSTAVRSDGAQVAASSAAAMLVASSLAAGASG